MFDFFKVILIKCIGWGKVLCNWFVLIIFFGKFVKNNLLFNIVVLVCFVFFNVFKVIVIKVCGCCKFVDKVLGICVICCVCNSWWFFVK